MTNCRCKSEVINSLQRFNIIYRSRGFVIEVVHRDKEFDVEEYFDIFVKADFHICAAGEHVPGIERSVRTVKKKGTDQHLTPYHIDDIQDL